MIALKEYMIDLDISLETSLVNQDWPGVFTCAWCALWRISVAVNASCCCWIMRNMHTFFNRALPLSPCGLLPNEPKSLRHANRAFIKARPTHSPANTKKMHPKFNFIHCVEEQGVQNRTQQVDVARDFHCVSGKAGHRLVGMLGRY